MKPAPVSPEQQVIHDNAIGLRLATELESQVHVKRSNDVTIYLRTLAEKLAAQAPELAKAPIGVLVIEPHRGKWVDLNLPGNRVYLSIGLLRSISHENELAAMLALECAHLAGRDVLKKVDEPMPDETGDSSPDAADPVESAPEATTDFFGPTGVYAYSQEDLLRSVDRAVDLLYKAGYDPRGLISILETYEARPGISPFDPATLEQLLARARAAIATRAPLLNPIVRSEKFLAVLKRIQKL